MHCRWPPLGPIQSHARLRLYRTRATTIWIHGYQAHLQRCGQPFATHRDGPDCFNRGT
jgi:hypothetical protein